MTAYEAVAEYLAAAFPTARRLASSSEASAAVPLFSVIEGDVERQLQIDLAVWDDFKGPVVVSVLRTNRVAETMRDQPGRRVVLTRDRCAELIVEITPLGPA
jgi:hypothetical protein